LRAELEKNWRDFIGTENRSADLKKKDFQALRRTFISGTQATAEKKAYLRNLCFNHRTELIFFDGR
jgi:hypothetical protein